MMKSPAALLIIFFVTLLMGYAQTTPRQSVVSNRTRIGDFIVEPATLRCAGFEWMIYGDENRNASVSVKYRKKGSVEWKDALPLLRIGGEKIYGHDQRWVYTTTPMFAGSIFNLDEATVYECRFQLIDPDGTDGIAEQTVFVETKGEPKPYANGRTYHVYPPNYKGQKQSPAFTGLNEAYYGEGNTGDWWNVPDPRVQPGDVILVHAGLYKGDRRRYADTLALDFHGAYVLTQKGTAEKPITIKAAGDGEVIFDGDGAYRLFDVMAADYHYFEGLTIRNTEIAFYAGLKRVMGCSGLTVKNCNIKDVGIAVVTYSADSKDFYIGDNTIVGRHDPDTLTGWYGLEKPTPLSSYYAIKVYGQGHVVCYNSISYFHDGVCVDTHGLPEADKECVSIDFYRNYIFNVSDDFIETDGGSHNIRVFENKGLNAYHAAISSQPSFGGPVYFIRNICYNVTGTAMKYTVRPAGVLTYNNTFVAEAAITQVSNAHFRNNLFLGHDNGRQNLNLTTSTRYSTLDYNGYRKKPEGQTRFRLRYPSDDAHNHADDKELQVIESPTLKDFQTKTGYEQHGVELEYNSIFQNVPLPDASRKGHVYPDKGLDFRLKAGSNAIDSGCILPNITDNFSGKAPDLGALETGKQELQYGPRKK